MPHAVTGARIRSFVRVSSFVSLWMAALCGAAEGSTRHEADLSAPIPASSVAVGQGPRRLALPVAASADEVQQVIDRSTTLQSLPTSSVRRLGCVIQLTSGLGKLKRFGYRQGVNRSPSYVKRTFDLSAYKGRTIRIHFNGVEGSTFATSFLIDDTALNVTQ